MQPQSPINHSGRTTPFSPIFNLRSNSNDNTILSEALGIISKIAPSSSQGNIDSSNYILSLTDSILEEIPPGTRTPSLRTLLTTLSEMQDSKNLGSSYNAPEQLQIQALQALKDLAPPSSSPRKGMLSPYYESKSPLTRERVNSINSESSTEENQDPYFEETRYFTSYTPSKQPPTLNLETIIENFALETPSTSKDLFNPIDEETTTPSRNHKPFSQNNEALSSFTKVSSTAKKESTQEQTNNSIDILASSFIQDLLQDL